VMTTLRTPEDMPIESGMVSKQIEGAQKKIEGQNFAIRKNVLKYDEVMNHMRTMIYGQRDKVLEGQELKPIIIKMLDDSVNETVDFFMSRAVPKENWNYGSLREKYLGYLTGPEDFMAGEPSPEEVKDMLIQRGTQAYEAREAALGGELMRSLERMVLLRSVDTHWMDHIDAMDELKRGIGLRAYAQQDPVVAYRMESFDMFEQMTTNIREDTVKYMLTLRVRTQAETERKQVAKVTSTNTPGAGAGGDGTEKGRTIRKGKKVGPNDLCPCGSGKKYKNCCGDVRKN